MERTNDYTTGNLLDHKRFSKHYRLIAIDLSKQTDLRQQINFIVRLDTDDGATMFFINKKSEKNNFLIFTRLCNHSLIQFNITHHIK